jgi:hypothetical protein
MAQPRTPEDHLQASAERLAAHKEATRKASEQVAADRAAQSETPAPEREPER